MFSQAVILIAVDSRGANRESLLLIGLRWPDPRQTQELVNTYPKPFLNICGVQSFWPQQVETIWELFLFEVLRKEYYLCFFNKN